MLEVTCVRINNAVTDRFFRHEDYVVWSTRGRTVNESLSLTIRHHTGFNYDGLAKSSYNEARMTPITGASQEVRNTHVAVQPVVPLSTHTDYFGTIVTSFDIQEPHPKLEVEARSNGRESRGIDRARDLLERSARPGARRLLLGVPLRDRSDSTRRRGPRAARGVVTDRGPAQLCRRGQCVRARERDLPARRDDGRPRPRRRRGTWAKASVRT